MKSPNQVSWPKDQNFSVIGKDQFCQGYCGYKTATTIKHENPSHKVWYTERNGDPITMICGSDIKDLPNYAMEYAALEWIDPEDDFTE